MPYITPATIPDDKSCVVLRIPADRHMIAAVFGALQDLTHAYNWEQIDGVTPEVAAAAADDLYWNSVAEDCEVPIQVGYQTDLFARWATPFTGTLTKTAATFMTFGYSMQTDNTVGRIFKQPLWLPAGDYNYRGLYAKNTNAGFTELRLNTAAGAIIIAAAIDQYGLFNAEFEYTTTFTLPDDTLYEMQVQNTGSKNASSGGYNAAWTVHHFERTA